MITLKNQVVCQSCGMPMNERSLFGIEKSGARSEDYCCYCYEKGEFKQPDLTLKEMTELCVSYMKEDGMEEDEARDILRVTLPSLKRWRKRVPS
ncbi:zinc ribbon domain-containing protein [Fictibacillus sp. Mic-4]